MKQSWHSGSLTAERNRYKEFIERLARTELEMFREVGTRRALFLCSRCNGDIAYDAGESTHLDCPVVEARQLLGWPTDERGNLVEER